LDDGGIDARDGVAGCRVHVDKGSNGEDKTVQVDTPFGGVHVNTDQVSASDLGLPVYPGAEMVKGDDQHKSADVHLGFGQWQLRVRAVTYATADSKDQVTAFYKKALGRYGDVITCQDKAAVGTPTATGEGLTCADSGKDSKVKIDSDDYGAKDGFQLKADRSGISTSWASNIPRMGRRCLHWWRWICPRGWIQLEERLTTRHLRWG